MDRFEYMFLHSEKIQVEDKEGSARGVAEHWANEMGALGWEFINFNFKTQERSCPLTSPDYSGDYVEVYVEVRGFAKRRIPGPTCR